MRISRYGKSGPRLLGLLLGTSMLASSALMPTQVQAQDVAPITIVINQSPWFDGFRCIVETYEEDTGNVVELDVNPFAGSLEKQRNSVRAADGLYDILIMNSGWYSEMYHGGFVTPITDIDADFTLDPGVYDHDNTIYHDAETGAPSPETGKLMSMPINPNIPLLLYREDLYEEHGLKVPETFEQLLANAKALHNPPEMYGIVQRGARGPHTVAYDFYPYLYGHGGSIFQDQDNGDFTVTLNSPEGMEALDYYIQLATEAGHPNTASQDQAQVIQAMTTGKAGHIITVIAAWPQMDDVNKSIVVDKVNLALPPSKEGLPSAPGLGHWLGGISHNVPAERQQGAVEFFKWFQTPEAQGQYAECGGVPVSAAAYESDMAEEREFRWMGPMEAGLPLAVNIYTFPEAAEVIAILELELNRAIAGETSTAVALNTMAEQIHEVMARHGYETGTLEPLAE
ncbi:MAG: extracellular solute-binding protein [Pseudomonadota bacterium]